MGSITSLWAWFAGLDPRIWQALIAGIVVASGWLVNGWSQRREARRLRDEKLRDVHKALFAEIRDVCASYWNDGESDGDGARLLALMGDDDGFVPFVPKEVHGRIYAAMIPQIDLLPRQTIDSIVAFYTVVQTVEALAEDMRGARFPRLEPARRRRIYADYIEIRERAFLYGQNALRLIEAYAEGGAAGAEKLLADLGSQ